MRATYTFLKSRFLIGIFFLFISGNLFAQKGWVITNPFPNTLDNLGDIYFINSNLGFLVAYVYRAPNPYWGKYTKL